MKSFQLLLILFLGCFLHAQNQVPQIENMILSDNGDQSLTINYDLIDAENENCTISLMVSDDNGISYKINTSNATGDINDMIVPGTKKAINWDHSNQISSSGNYTIKLVANDLYKINIQDIVDQVDSNNLRSDLELIVGERNARNGIKHYNEVRQLIFNRFTNYCGNATNQNYVYQGLNGRNIITEQLGNSSEGDIYIMDAHYDSVNRSPGADDNGSGVAGMFEAARILSQYQFGKTIRYIGFDMEEIGLIGAGEYTSSGSVKDDNILGVINFEAIGFFRDTPNSQTFPRGFNLLYPDEYNKVSKDSFKGNFIFNLGLADQNEWERVYARAANKYVPDLKLVTVAAPPNWQAVAPDFGRSDHARFWLINKPAIMLTTTTNFRNPNYHKPTDVISTIDFERFSLVVKAAVATLAEQAEIQHSTIAVDSIDIVIDGITLVDNCSTSIYPNPVVDFISIQFKECTSFPIQLQVFNLDAKLIHDEIITNNSDHKIDASSWINGVYIVKYNNKEKRFVK